MISNWDCLAVDEMNNSTNGVFVSPDKVRVVVYQNELVSEHLDHSWSIKSGQLEIGDTSIICDTGPKDGIYFAIYSKDPFRAMVGIGSKGYSAEAGYVGIEQDDVEWLKELMVIWSGYAIPELTYGKLKDIDVANSLRHNQGDAKICHEFKSDIPATKPGCANAPLLQYALRAAR